MAKVTVVGLGDSTTAGTPGFRSPLESPPDGRGNPESQYSYWMMKAHPAWTVLNRGINRQRSDQILARFERDVAHAHPAIVVVLAGVNDIYQGRPTDSVKRNLSAIYSLAVENKIVPVAASVLPFDASGDDEFAAISELNSWIEDQSKAERRLFCDTNKAVRDLSNPRLLASSPDGLHPDPAGYRRMGEALSATLVRAGY